MKFRITFIILALFFAAYAPAPSYGQQEGSMHTERRVSGTVEEVDFVGNKIALNAYGDVLVFYVSDETVVTRGTDTISIEYIEQGDPLTIYYYVDSDGSLRATRISDSNIADE